MTPLIKWTAIICTVLLVLILVYLCDYYGLEERNALKKAKKVEHDILHYKGMLEKIERKIVMREAIFEHYGVEWAKLNDPTR